MLSFHKHLLFHYFREFFLSEAHYPVDQRRELPVGPQRTFLGSLDGKFSIKFALDLTLERLIAPLIFVYLAEKHSVAFLAFFQIFPKSLYELFVVATIRWGAALSQNFVEAGQEASELSVTLADHWR